MTGRAATGELALIHSIRGRSARRAPGLALGIGDDCAVLQPPNEHQVVVTTDFSLEGRHFDRSLQPARSAGHRCLARGLSDLAAMGAKPLAAFLSLALTQRLSRPWVDGFLDGLLALADATRTPLAGGDTAAAPGKHILADIVLTGSVPRGTFLRRCGARAGDLLYVTGSLGGAAAELEALLAHPRKFRNVSANADHPHLFPQPRLRAGWLLRERAMATAAIDISDGLSTDLHHLCEESGVGAVVDAALLPVHPLAKSLPDSGLQAALHGGEDYELLFAARPGAMVLSRIGGVAVRRIGRFTRAKAILLDRNGRREPLAASGWEHVF